MVARDGIEPPTPAFSGPRSTTELPGLSADFQLQFPARNPALPEKGGRVHEQCAATTWLVYQLRLPWPNSARFRSTSSPLLHYVSSAARASARCYPFLSFICD